MAGVSGVSGSGTGSGTTRGPRRFVVEITTVRTPAVHLRDYCTDEQDCTGCGADLGGGGPGTSGASGSGTSECNFGYSWMDPGTSGDSGECDNTADPDCPPAWWLTQEGNRLILHSQTFFPAWHALGEAMLCAASITPSDGHCLTAADIVANAGAGAACATVGGIQLGALWQQIQSLWAFYLIAHPGAVDLHCLGITDPNDQSTPGHLQWTRGRSPPGSRILGKRCVIVTESELCAICPS